MPTKAGTTTIADLPSRARSSNGCAVEILDRQTGVDRSVEGRRGMTTDPVRCGPSTLPIDREPCGYLYLRKENEALVWDTLASAGVELGEYDDLILRWLATWEFGTVAVVALGIARAARLGSANSADLVQNAPANTAHDADSDCVIETPLVSAGARYASAKQTRAALRRHQAASGTGRGPDDVAEPGRGV